MDDKRIELFPGKDCLRADGTIFLTDDAGPVHGPGQAASAVDKGGSDFYRALFNIPAESLAFIETDGPDGGGRAKIAAGDTIMLAPAGADSKIEHRCPQAFQAGGQTGRVDYIGRADAHALAASYAAGQKLLFRQAARRSDQVGIPVRTRIAADPQHRDYGDSRHGCDQ